MNPHSPDSRTPDSRAADSRAADSRTRRPVTGRAQLLSAARLGSEVARADLAGHPESATGAYASWRRLRRYADQDTRALLRMAFDTGYGQTVQAAGVLPPSTAAA